MTEEHGPGIHVAHNTENRWSTQFNKVLGELSLLLQVPRDYNEHGQAAEDGREVLAGLDNRTDKRQHFIDKDYQCQMTGRSKKVKPSKFKIPKVPPVRKRSSNSNKTVYELQEHKERFHIRKKL